MGDPKLRWGASNAQTINFLEAPDRVDPSYPRFRQQQRSLSGKAETLNEHQQFWLDAFWSLLTNASGATDSVAKRRLRAFESYARAGNTFEFMVNASEDANTTLNADVAAGASSVVIATAGSITTGNLYIVRSLKNIELVHIATVSGTSIGLTDPLQFSYDSGARFRAEQFVTARLREGGVIAERVPIGYDVTLRTVEDTNDLGV